MNALIGRKVGMTRVFGDDGRQVPVTVLEVGPCVVTQLKTADKDGYSAVQVGFEEQKPQRVNKPLTGHFAKSKASPRRILREIRVDDGETPELGAEVGVSIFDGATYVDVTAKTKGRGFQGVMKRHNFGGGRASHGSHNKRGPGSIGQCEFPGRVWKNKKMPGQMGSARVTTQNLKVVAVRPEDNVILVEGSVPGPSGGLVTIKKAIKKA